MNFEGRLPSTIQQTRFTASREHKMTQINYNTLWVNTKKPARVEYALLEHADLLGLTDCDIIVALALYDHQGKNPDTFVGQNLLCKELGGGFKQIRTSLQRLVRKGLLEITQDHHNGRVHNRYNIRPGFQKLGYDSSSNGWHRDFLRYGCLWFGLDIHDAALYTYLNSKQGKDASCWPTLKQMSYQLGVGGVHHDSRHKQLKKSIAKLTEVGLISVKDCYYDCSLGRKFFSDLRAIKPLLGIAYSQDSTPEQFEKALVDAVDLGLGVAVHCILETNDKVPVELRERASSCLDNKAFWKAITTNRSDILWSIKEM